MDHELQADKLISELTDAMDNDKEHRFKNEFFKAFLEKHKPESLTSEANVLYSMIRDASVVRNKRETHDKLFQIIRELTTPSSSVNGRKSLEKLIGRKK